MKLLHALPLLALLGCASSPAPADAARDVPDASLLDAPATDVPADVTVPRDTPDVPPAQRITAPYTRYVDPFIGTGGVGFGVGSAFPGPQVPFGLARPGPDTTSAVGALGFAHCSGYSYADDRINAFSLVRLHGTGIPDLGGVGFMPALGMSPARTRDAGHTTVFSHSRESASPGYYQVTLDDGIRVELTATQRVALQRFTFPSAGDPVVLIDLAHVLPQCRIDRASLTVSADAREVAGSARVQGAYSDRFGGVEVHFVARFSAPFARWGTWQGDDTLRESVATADNPISGFYAHFTERAVTAAIGISYSDIAHARMNLDAESPRGDFDAARRAAEALWETRLAIADIDATPDDAEMFYTAIYHALLMPTRTADVDGTYRGLDNTLHRAEGFDYYNDFSLWDTYRTLHPLLALIAPAETRDMMRTFAAMGRDAGFVPRWPLAWGETRGMVGESADIVVADAWSRGIRDFDVRGVYNALRRTALPRVEGDRMVPYRSDLAHYDANGWCATESGGSSASRTLEYNYDDHCLAILADAVNEPADAARFRRRAGGWRNLLAPGENHWLLGRSRDGSWPTVTNDRAWQTYYAEGNVWQYQYFVPHDLEGLAAATGGRAAMLDRLHALFERSEAAPPSPLPAPYYWHGNEPDLHYAWIFPALDDLPRGARWVRWVLRRHYTAGPEGLPGNDDGGTMSAWLIYGMLGFYPLAGTDLYFVASPALPRATLHLPGGDLNVLAPGASDIRVNPTSVTLNKTALPRPRFTHGAIVNGATLRFDLAP